MGKYKELEEFSEKQFRRLTDVQRGTFEKMVAVLLEAQQRRYRKVEEKSSLSIEDKFLMALEYLREYRTYFHLGRSYGVRDRYRNRRKRFSLRFTSLQESIIMK